MKSNRLQLHTPSSSATVDWAKYKTKNYLHFDNPLNIRRVKDRIVDPEWIKSHAFLPFIQFDIIYRQYKTKNNSKITRGKNGDKDYKEKVEKRRTIMYASHVDQFIYKYYGDMLNNYYNDYATKHGLDESIIAYRNNKKGKSTIHFAAEVFKYILKQNNVLVISVDFKGFFDNIAHRELKKSIKTVMGTNELPDDLYSIFKNTTKYSYVAKDSIDNFLLDKYGKDKLKLMVSNHQLKRIMSDKEFRQFKKKSLLKNKKPYGIPQGSGMSAVCSNIHLIEFDKHVINWAKRYNALYRRYSDDVIIAIPLSENDNIKYLKKSVLDIVSKYKHYGLEVQKDKTEVRILKKGKILDEAENPSRLDYLGLVMDGHSVQIREKSLFKYYSRAYRKAKECRNVKQKTDEKYGWKKLYKLYTHLGMTYKGYGNFIVYANRAHEEMLRIGLHSNINNQIKRHWNKIQNRLNN